MKYNKSELIILLQKYLPIILENEMYFKSYMLYLLKKYNFKVNEDHLRKKLNIYLKESFRTDEVKLAQRLIRGEFESEHEENWIWLSSEDVALTAQTIVEV